MSTVPSDMDLAARIASLLRASAEPSDELLDKHGFPRSFATIERTARRSIPPSKQIEVYYRDHFIDRYTGEHLIFPGALLLLGELYPDAFPKAGAGAGWRIGKCHWIYWRLWPTVDHVVPIAKGGAALDISNLVTTCQMINTAKGAWTDDAAPPAIRFQLIDEATVQKDPWNGLLNWFTSTMNNNPKLLGRDAGIDRWYRTAKSFFTKKQLVPDGDGVWDLRDFD